MNKNFGWTHRSERKGVATWVVGDPTSADKPSLVFQLGVQAKRVTLKPSEIKSIPWSEVAKIATGETTLETLKEAYL